MKQIAVHFIIRRFTHTNIYETGSVEMENSPQNVRGYFYSAVQCD